MAEEQRNSGVSDPDILEVDTPGSYGTPGPAVARAMKKRIFPVGIFFILLAIESLIAAGVSLAYFYYAGRSGIASIESNTRTYITPLAESFGTMAELCYRTKKYDRLKGLFREKLDKRVINEAFFILKNGRLAAHSDPAVEQKFRKANVEAVYTMDLVLLPAYRASRDVLYTEYGIPSKRVPFDRRYRELIKTYLYHDIDSTGWLASRAVYRKKKPVGAVCIIIGKDSIYSFIRGHLERSGRILSASLLTALAVSFLVSLLIFFRYRSIQKRALAWAGMGASAAHADRFYDMTPYGETAAYGDEPVFVELLSVHRGEGGAYSYVPATPFHPAKKIREAIPVLEEE
ncbi:MAG: hypothetical protein JW807_15325 [Spirochaetes bacterium]|nr:hypothetical protein [Spirochaetota bacterium]